MPTTQAPLAMHRPLKWTISPHILLAPSILSPFYKHVDSTVCINPGSAIKNNRLNNMSFIQLKSEIAMQTIKL